MATTRATGSAGVIREEKDAIDAAREALRQRPGPHNAWLEGQGTGGAGTLAGLALSGGGIRSATFNLGVLQALAANKLLTRFDYLSTVSGGGYIGAWLTAWIHRAACRKVGNADRLRAGGPAARAACADALIDVEKTLGGQPQPDGSSGVEPGQVAWLRTCSRYLAPGAGALGMDSVTLATTWMRNVFLNLLIMAALLSAVLISIRALAVLLHWLIDEKGWLPLGELTAIAGAAFFGAFAVQLCAQDPKQRRAFAHSFLYRWFGDHRWTLWLGVGYLVLAGLWAGAYRPVADAGPKQLGIGVVISVGIGLAAAVAVTLWLGLVIWGKHRRESPSTLAAPLPMPWRKGRHFVEEALIFIAAGAVAVAAAIACMLGVQLLLSYIGRDGMFRIISQMTFAPGLALVAFGICGSLFVGVVGRAYSEASREWWARLNAFFLRTGIALLLLMGLSFGAGAVDWLWERASGWLGALLASGWVASALTALFGSRVRAKDEKRQRRLTSLLNACALLFAAGLVVLASAMVHTGINGVLDLAHRAPALTAGERGPERVEDCVRKVREHVRNEPKLAPEQTATSRMTKELADCVNARVNETAGILQDPRSRNVLLMALAACVAVFVLLGYRVDVNRFSLHDLYKVRLIRCYLGASRSRNPDDPDARAPNLFTGFDLLDDVALDSIAKTQRPLHLLNAAVNLNVQTHLAWQDRKAASFTFSPLHCGFVPPFGEALIMADASGAGRADDRGFVHTERYGSKAAPAAGASAGANEGGVTLGSAVAVSGAAVSPGSGMNTRPALAFLLTLFNLRTGRWSPNPLSANTDKVSPAFGPRWLLRELFGFTNSDGQFVHLSDGGHFENLGIYELVRRECKLIVCVDATADGQRGFGDLGNAIRRCRVDFGAEISIDTRKQLPDSKGTTQALVVSATIRYRGAGGDGRLIYVKPSIPQGKRGLVPRDILSHQVQEPDFPHVSTADQFFSETQFESYRRLGEWAGGKLVEALGKSELPPETPTQSRAFWIGSAALGLVLLKAFVGRGARPAHRPMAAD